MTEHSEYHYSLLIELLAEMVINYTTKSEPKDNKVKGEIEK